MKSKLSLWLMLLALSITVGCNSSKKEVQKVNENRPNVILIMTDDQGYGDLGRHGNTIIKTPNLDRLYDESIRFTDFHVSPFCTPTRGALMTGRYPERNGAYRTSSGRTMLHTDEQTIADVFAYEGYTTGMVGKWHLGDNAPHRPQDHGFQDVVWHKSGGVGQASDYWGNDYFDDTYERNGIDEKFEGYCTDVWFRESMSFVEENKDKPFFLYLATNAPHGPYLVGEEWSDPYKETVPWRNGAAFYGMISNFDHNLGLLRKRLEELNLTENTILIFMTDNGTSAGGEFKGLDSEPMAGYNAGMRGKKSSVYDGGHRVPFFIHWPKKGIEGGRDIGELAAHIDVLPTLSELCGITIPNSHQPDGISLASLLTEEGKSLERESIFVQFNGGAGNTDDIGPFLNSAVLSKEWRLINGNILYNIKKDPSQSTDVASENPEIVTSLRKMYNPWWESVAGRLQPVRIDVGNPVENPTILCSQDWYLPEGNPPWNFTAIKKLPQVTGPWMLDVKRAGRYRITLRQFPKEANIVVDAISAKIEIAGQIKESVVHKGSKGVIFELELPAGPTELVTYLYNQKGQVGGAYFTEVEALK